MSWRATLNRWRRRLRSRATGRMLFGEWSNTGADAVFRRHTRIEPSTVIDGEGGLRLADHVFIGPLCFLEAHGGIELGEGVQLTHHVSIVTHSSHRALRLLGRRYVHHEGLRPGWVSGKVSIGAWTFVGPHVIIEAGTVLGEGCIVRAGSVVRGRFAAHSIVAGQPAVVVGDARVGDERWLAADPALRATWVARPEARE